MSDFRARPVAARTVQTVDELNDLPEESVVKERDTAMSFVYWKGAEDTWCIPADDTDYRSSEIALPAVVLWEPSMSEEWNPNYLQQDLVNITSSLAEIAEVASDPEQAHALEVTLYKQALRKIRRGAPGPMDIAAKALEAESIDFERWFA